MESEPRPPSPSASTDSAVGLAFVAVVLLGLFTAGGLGVLVTRAADEPPGPAPAMAASVPAAAVVRDRIYVRFKELVLLREIALRERDPLLLQSVYAPGASGLARDRAEIARLRRSGRRLDGLRLPVRVFNAYRPGGGRWVVIARLGRSPARLVTDSGRPVRPVEGRDGVYRCTLVRRDGRWLLSRLTP
jgi:hypothetical protein